MAIENLEDKSTAELLKLLSMQLTDLVHHELELARAEMGRKSKKFGLGAGIFGSAGVFALAALGAFATAAIAGIATALGVWEAALVVAGACLLIAGTVALAGLTELAQGTPPLPEEALESTKEDLTWIKTHARSTKP